MLWMFMLFISHFAAYCTTFSSILPCVLQQIAVHLAANSPKCGANGGPFK